MAAERPDLDLDFLKDRYDFELDRKDKLTTSLTLPVGILTGLGGLIAIMAQSFTYEDELTTAAHEFQARLRRSIIEAADTNTRNNDDRSNYLYLARVALFAVLTLSALAGLPYVFDQVRGRMSQQQTGQQGTGSQSTGQPTTSPGATPTHPPSFPANRIIREGGTPTEKKCDSVIRLSRAAAIS